MPGDPDLRVGYINYNGINFPPAMKTSMSSRGIYTRSGRVIKHIEITLRVECIFSGGDFAINVSGGDTYTSENAETTGLRDITRDSQMDNPAKALILKLSEPRKTLVIEGIGFGNFYIDNDESISSFSYTGDGSSQIKYAPDLANGPKPQVLDYASPTGGKVIHVLWSVTFTVSPCPKLNMATNVAPFSSFDFSTHFNVDQNGVFSRSIYGEVEVPNWTVPSTNMPKFNVDNVDGVLGVKDRILKAFPLIADCSREHTFTTSEDRTKVSFTIIDKQHDSDEPFYPGCSNVRLRTSLRTMSPVAGISNSDNTKLMFSFVISASIDVYKGVPKSVAWNAFTTYLKWHIIGSLNEGQILQGFTIDNDRTGRNLSVTATFLITSPVHYIFSKTNFLETMKEIRTDGKAGTVGKSWNQWNAFRQSYGATEPYGVDGKVSLSPEKDQDHLVSLCSPPKAVPTKPIPEKKDNEKKVTLEETPLRSKYSEKSSYISYANKTWYDSTMSVSTHSLLGKSDASGKTTPNASASPQGNKSNVADQSKPVDVTPALLLSVTRSAAEVKSSDTGVAFTRVDDVAENIIQQHGAGKHFFYMQGHGERVGYHVDIPSVESTGRVGGQVESPVLVKDAVSPSHVARYTADGIPIYRASWYRVYCLPSLKSREIVLKNVQPEALSAGKPFPGSTIAEDS
jgi:hypothetical protein